MTGSDINLKVFGRSDTGKQRSHNEDAFIIADLTSGSPSASFSQPVELQLRSLGVLLAVSDGMGGAAAGEVASALTLHCLHLELPVGTGGTAETALIASVERANERVFQTAATTGLQGMGATLTAVLIHENRAYVAEVGDSRAYVLRGSLLVQLTRDQSYVQLLVDQGVITREETDKFEHKNVILQAIGTQASVVVALNRFTLRQGDRILLCSDGLTSELSDDEIRGALLMHARVDVACHQLIELANSRGGRDNITVVLAEMNGEGLPVVEDDERVSLETIQAFDPHVPG